MTTRLLIGLLVWMIGVEWRLWVNIHRLNEHLEELQCRRREQTTRPNEKRRARKGPPLSRIEFRSAGQAYALAPHAPVKRNL